MWAELIRMRNFKNRGPQSFFGPESTESLSFCNEDSVEIHVRHSRNTGKERPQHCLKGMGGFQKDFSAKSYHREESATYMKYEVGMRPKE